MAVSTWVYDLATGRFLYGGFYAPPFDPSTQGTATFADTHPDPTVEKWDTVNRVVVALTPTELSTDVSNRRASEADVNAAQRPVAATVFYILRVNLGRNPTPAELAAGVAVWKTIYKALP